MEGARDNGTIFGGPSRPDGTHAATVKRPSFEPLSFDVEWKSLPSELMDSVLGLPYRIARLDENIDASWENAIPPEYGNYFWERQHDYAVLGLAVVELAHQLRQHASLPTHADGCDRVGLLKDTKKEVEEMWKKNRSGVPPPPSAVPELA